MRPLRDTEAPAASVLSAEPMPERFAISAFGFRISGFLRISALGFRISGLPAWLSLCGRSLQQPCRRQGGGQIAFAKVARLAYVSRVMSSAETTTS